MADTEPIVVWLVLAGPLTFSRRWFDEYLAAEANDGTFAQVDYASISGTP